MSRKRPPSIDFYYEDFYSGTMGMHPLAVGMYIRTICFQLAHDSVPEEPRKLCQILGVTPDEFHEHWGEVEEKLTQRSDGSYVNERAQVEMEKKLALSEVRSKCGQKGGRPSKANGKLKVKQNESKTKAIGKKEVGSRKKEDRKKEEGSRKEEEAYVQSVWEHYKTRRPRVRVLGEDVRNKILARKREGFTADDLIAAIDGNFRSPHHCGENATGTEYHELELIVRDSRHVNQFVNAGASKGGCRAVPTKITAEEAASRRRVREIIRAGRKAGVSDAEITVQLTAEGLTWPK